MSEWGENSTQIPSISVDPTSEREAPFLSVQRGAGVEKPQNPAPGQELRKPRMQVGHEQSVACSHHNGQTQDYTRRGLK